MSLGYDARALEIMREQRDTSDRNYLLAILYSRLMEGRNGYFFKDGDADSLAERIREMFESPERCREMGKESERIIREKINMETVSKRYLKAFQEIISQ